MTVTRAVVELERARREGTPLIDGDGATFVWRGATAPQLIGDFTHWEAEPMALLRRGARLWVRRLEFFHDAYVEYAYLGTRGRLPDRFNGRVVPNRVGATNHFFYMPGGGPTPLARRRRGVPGGALTSHTLAAESLASSEARRVHLYAPAARGPWPLLVILDGNDYLRRAQLATIVDNLVADGRVRPLAMAFLQNAGRARVIEYACNDATLTLLTERLLPFARQHLDLLRAPGAHGILGASIGGLMALYAGLRAPDVFGTVLSQSGAFTLLGVDTIAFQLVGSQPGRRLRIWMDVGHLERLRPANRRMRAALASRGYEVSYREYHAGHNWTAWRNDVWRGLESLFEG